MAPWTQPRSENGVMSPALEGQGPGSPPPLCVLAPASRRLCTLSTRPPSRPPHAICPGPWPSSLTAPRPWLPAAPAQAGSGHSGCPAAGRPPTGAHGVGGQQARKTKQNIILTAKASPGSYHAGREAPRDGPQGLEGFIGYHRAREKSHFSQKGAQTEPRESLGCSFMNSQGWPQHLKMPGRKGACPPVSGSPRRLGGPHVAVAHNPAAPAKELVQRGSSGGCTA